ncbi:MAG: hypothetical protein BWY65_02432 [Firmicutes bacterium ADurb.Bin373]|nr:MAG: hypothetical protein BWY65_02432 [Firmicutes bacterium ADurb.Bin373]
MPGHKPFTKFHHGHFQPGGHHLPNSLQAQDSATDYYRFFTCLNSFFKFYRIFQVTQSKNALFFHTRERRNITAGTAGHYQLVISQIFAIIPAYCSGRSINGVYFKTGFYFNGILLVPGGVENIEPLIRQVLA